MWQALEGDPIYFRAIVLDSFMTGGLGRRGNPEVFFLWIVEENQFALVQQELHDHEFSGMITLTNGKIDCDWNDWFFALKSLKGQDFLFGNSTKHKSSTYSRRFSIEPYPSGLCPQANFELPISSDDLQDHYIYDIVHDGTSVRTGSTSGFLGCAITLADSLREGDKLSQDSIEAWKIPGVQYRVLTEQELESCEKVYDHYQQKSNHDDHDKPVAMPIDVHIDTPDLSTLDDQLSP
jgi:hypothetical protein